MISDGFWGEPLFGYTRADALRDGVLLDITETARLCARLEVPTAVTAGLWKALAPGEPFNPQVERCALPLLSFRQEDIEEEAG